MTDTKFAIQLIAPTLCSPDEIKAFCAHVNSGEEVARLSPDWVLGHGVKLAFVRTGGALAAVGALKRPDQNYHQGCFRKANIASRWSDYPIELGWIYCDEAYRGGMSYKIIDALTQGPEGGQSWYATVRTDNPAMLHPLGKRHFESAGTPYKSVEHPAAKIRLLLRAGGSSN